MNPEADLVSDSDAVDAGSADALSLTHQTVTRSGLRTGVNALTYEHLLWAALALLAAAMRLWFLDNTPLNNAEAQVTLQSFGLATLGNGITQNPLFGIAQSWLFTLTKPSDFSARLIDVLAGVALCLVPLLLHDRWGRGRALGLGVLLALSPTVWYVSRQADGAILGWTLAFALYAAWRSARRNTSALLLGLLLACGIDGLSPLIACALVIAATGELNVHLISRRFGLIALLALVLGSSGLLLRPAGLGDVFGGVAAWFTRMTTTGTLPLGRAFMGLWVYELPLLFGTLGSLILLIVGGRQAAGGHQVAGGHQLFGGRQFDRAEIAWLSWLGAGLILLVLDRGRSAADVVPIIIGLAGFTTRILDWLSTNLYRFGRWSLEGPYIALMTVTYICAGLGIRQYASTNDSSWLMLSLLAIVLSAAAITSTGMLGDMGIGVRGVVAGLALNLLLYSVAAGAHLVWVQPTNPAEPYITEAVPMDVRTLAQTVQTISTRSQGDPNVMKVQIQRNAPASLRWALHDQAAVLVTENTGDEGVIITPETAPPTPRGNSGYVGSKFVVQTRSSLDSVRCNRNDTRLDCTPLARWFAFRKGDTPAQTSWVLWVRGDVANKASGLP